MKVLCIYGCGGMGREIADLTSRMDKWGKIIFVDDNIKSRVVDEVSVFTLEETLNQFDKLELEFIVAAGEPTSREFLYKKLDKHNLDYICVIDQGLTYLGSLPLKMGQLFILELLLPSMYMLEEAV